jgi:hypothetical protein
MSGAKQGEEDYWLLMNLVFYGKIEDYRDIEAWFGVPAQSPPQAAHIIAKQYNLTVLPDLCGNCHTVFGATLGGRLRHSCPCCRVPGQAWDSNPIGKQVSLFWRYTQCLEDSPIIHYLHSVYPTRYYDGTILEKKHELRHK